MNINDFFETNNLELKNKTLVLAASGGPDSMALADLLYQLSKIKHFKLILAHFDHQLRKDSYLETELLNKYATDRNLKLVIGSWSKYLHPEVGIEAAARDARYNFLNLVMDQNKGDYLLTAHHGDDLVENILLKFIRSGNPDEMNSLKAVSSWKNKLLLRPLLKYSKAELLSYVNKMQLEFIQDQTNFEDLTLRNRLRHHVVPLLRKENPNLIDSALRYSKMEDTLSRFAKDKFGEIGEPKKFLDKFYRINKTRLASLTDSEQVYYWQNMIWKKFKTRVGDNLGDFTVKVYQDYYYLWQNDELNKSDNTKLTPIWLDQIFTFQDRKFILTLNEQDRKLIGDFYAEKMSMYSGILQPGAVFLLKNSHHAKAKKMFANSSIPNQLRKYCLSIFDKQKRPVFVEKTYRNQKTNPDNAHYFIYEIKNDKKNLKD